MNSILMQWIQLNETPTPSPPCRHTERTLVSNRGSSSPCPHFLLCSLIPRTVNASLCQPARKTWESQEQLPASASPPPWLMTSPVLSRNNRTNVLYTSSVYNIQPWVIQNNRCRLEEHIQTDELNIERISALKCEERCSQETYNLIGNRLITTDFAGSENCSADEKHQH